MTPETTPAPTGSAPVAWRDEQPFSPRYDDRYHTLSGARTQAEHVFLGGCGLPGAWSGHAQPRSGQQESGGRSCPGDGHPPTSGPADSPHRHADDGTHTTAAAGAVPEDGSVPPACWTILETGFGLGLNFLSAWACWQGSTTRPATLRFVSTEAHPVTAEDIRRAAADDPVLQPLAQRLADAWPDTTTMAAWYPGNDAGAHPCHPDAESGPPVAERAPWPATGADKLPVSDTGADPDTGAAQPPMPDSPPRDSPTHGLPQAAAEPPCLILRFAETRGTVELQLLLGDAATSLQARHARCGSIGADSVFLDGFDPKKNPAMWDARVMQAVACHCRPGTRIATWCVARSVRDALAGAGFVVQRRPGLPPKRHCLTGQWPDAAPLLPSGAEPAARIPPETVTAHGRRPERVGT